MDFSDLSCLSAIYSFRKFLRPRLVGLFNLEVMMTE